MPVLSQKLLPTGFSAIDFSKPNALPPVRILQFGDGNFLRAFVDWMVDSANGQGIMNGQVTVSSNRSSGIIDALKAQDCLYTVLLRGQQDNQLITSKRVITCIKKAINPQTDWQALVEAAEDPALRFVVSNTTEAGIAYMAEEQSSGVSPVSFPARIAALLYARYQKLGKTSAPGLVFLPCELIEANGKKLRDYVLAHAQNWMLEADFITWVKKNNFFLNTLVDRIVPGFPVAEKESIFQELGYEDPLLVAAEPFHMWVIEAPDEHLKTLAESFPLHKAGLNVIWTHNLEPFRTRKVRILNGVHTASSLAAYLAGIDTVKSMIEDEEVFTYIKSIVSNEIIPFIPLPEDDCKAYAQTIFERFANPSIRHELIAISLNSVSKWQVRVLPTLMDFLHHHENPPEGLSFSLAALIRFYKGVSDGGDGLLGIRDTGQTYRIKDNPEVLSFMAEAWENWEVSKDNHQITHVILKNEKLWGRDLNRIPELVNNVSNGLSSLVSKGTRETLKELNKSSSIN